MRFFQVIPPSSLVIKGWRYTVKIYLLCIKKVDRLFDVKIDLPLPQVWPKH